MKIHVKGKPVDPAAPLDVLYTVQCLCDSIYTFGENEAIRIEPDKDASPTEAISRTSIVWQCPVCQLERSLNRGMLRKFSEGLAKRYRDKTAVEFETPAGTLRGVRS